MYVCQNSILDHSHRRKEFLLQLCMYVASWCIVLRSESPEGGVKYACITYVFVVAHVGVCLQLLNCVTKCSDGWLLLQVLKGHDDHVITCLEFCGSKIVSGSDDNTLKVWSAVNGKVASFASCLSSVVCLSLLYAVGRWRGLMHIYSRSVFGWPFSLLTCIGQLQPGVPFSFPFSSLCLFPPPDLKFGIL